MNPAEVHTVLERIGATELHHANTVPTSCTFLEQGGLLSRGYVERNGLIQTPQPDSDYIDKKYLIWDRIFLDHVDIHGRAGRKKGPNYYGPVLFEFDVNTLLELPAQTEVLVTKQNPVHWTGGQRDEERYYLTAKELSENLAYGNFDKMLVIKLPDEKLVFPRNFQIRLDDPQRKLSSGENAYVHAEKRLETAAAKSNVRVTISPHECCNGCICVQRYEKYIPQYFDSRFQ